MPDPSFEEQLMRLKTELNELREAFIAFVQLTDTIKNDIKYEFRQELGKSLPDNTKIKSMLFAP